jgi:cytochrome P450
LRLAGKSYGMRRAGTIRRTPNRHLAFGFGIHQCAGLSLARLEARVAIGRFVQRFPAYRVDGEPTRGARVRFRGFAAVPIELEPRPG